MDRFPERDTDLDDVTVGHPLDLPRLIEAGSERDLGAFLQARGSQVLQRVYRYGAVLLRGFAVRDAPGFEQAMARVEGLAAMRSYLAIEPGRDRLPGTTAAFTTSSLLRTGGGLPFTAFHSENYYSPQVPALQAFCCLRAPWFGGETGLVHMAGAYPELPADLRARVEATPVLTTAIPMTEVARRESLDVDTVRQRCLEEQLAVRTYDGVEYLVVYKPPVFEHPFDGRRALLGNLSLELPGLMGRFVPRMLQCYRGKRWAAHRYLWRTPKVRTALERLLDPRAWIPAKPRPRPAVGRTRHRPEYPRLGNLIAHPDEVDALAAAMWRHTTAVPWQRGDVLLFDNLQVLHAGLPGFGPRELAVQMYNPFVPDYREGGVCRPAARPGDVCTPRLANAS